MIKETAKISDIDITDFLNEIEDNKKEFNSMCFRQEHPNSPHTDTKTIYFRMCKDIDFDSVFNDIEAINYPASKWPEYQKIMDKVKLLINPDQIGRVMLVQLKINGEIRAHSDTGLYPDHYKRYHLPIKANYGNYFILDRAYEMKTGELWQINNSEEHYAVNYSKEPRWLLIMDMI